MRHPRPSHSANLMAKTEEKEKALQEELERAKAEQFGTTPMAKACDRMVSTIYEDWHKPDSRLEIRQLIRNDGGKDNCERVQQDL